jgi:Domain of unknown function (DUF4124)
MRKISQYRAMVFITLGVMVQSCAARIYTCTDAQGRHITSDRPIADCLDRDQRELNKDGSQRRVVSARMSPSEQLAAQKLAQAQEAERQRQLAAVRRDRLLLQRFPTLAAHDAARTAALDDVRQAMARTEKRVNDLRIEAKKLKGEAQFYVGRPVPPKLKTQLDVNDALQGAQAEIIMGHVAEIKRLNASYDAERAYLQKLWAGAPPGSLPEPNNVASR